MKIDVIDKQAEFIVVSKPAKVSFQDENNLGEGFFNQVKLQLNLPELYPVHRLDKITSGLMVMARSKAAANEFQQLFSQHQIEKYYLAISNKKPKKKQGLIKGDMTKSRRGAYKLTHTTSSPAITQFFSYSIVPGKRLFLLKPHSGKTHQIRVALNSLSAPILGDSLYGGSDADRGYLHAYGIKFSYQQKAFEYLLVPDQGEQFLLDETKNLLTSIDKPWQLIWPKV